MNHALFQVDIGFWDAVLVVGVGIQVTVLAYVYDPRWKAFVYSLPVPFTFATLAVGRPVDATNALAVPLLLLYINGVRWLHTRLRVPIIPSIVIAAGGYCTVGALAAPLVSPCSETAFWSAAGLNLVLGWLIFKLTPPRAEEGHRSPLPIPVKLAAVTAVILGLMMLKRLLAGFTTVFPFAGVVAAYESRKSLWTMCRQVSVIMLSLTPMIMLIHATQRPLGIGTALVLGWLVELLILGYFTHRIMRVEAPYGEADRVEADNRIYSAREETVPRPQSNNRPEER